MYYKQYLHGYRHVEWRIEMDGWDKFATYVGVQGILALLITTMILIAMMKDIAVPDTIYTLAGAAWGFYFAKNGYTLGKPLLKKHKDEPKDPL